MRLIASISREFHLNPSLMHEAVTPGYDYTDYSRKLTPGVHVHLVGTGGHTKEVLHRRR